MSAGPLVFSLPAVEGRYLHDLVEEFAQVVAASDDDPGVARLTPDIYPGDPDASATFRGLMHDDLLNRRRHDARVVLAALQPFADDTHATGSQDVTVADGDLDAWLRTLSALRLIMADRLGIATSDDHDPDDLRFGVYDWVGYRLDLLVQLADERDTALGG